MRLRAVSVKGLFGRFNHEFSLTSSDQITILTAPNGYGKTALLSLIMFFFSKQFAKMRRYEFTSVTFWFSDSIFVVVTKSKETRDGGNVGSKTSLVFTCHGRGPVEPFNYSRGDEPLSRELSIIDRYIPYLTRVGPDSWIDDRDGRSYTLEEVIDTFADMLPKSLQRLTDIPEWLSDVIQSTECHMIETQRLLRLDVDYDGRYPSRRPKASRSVVEGNAEDLAQKIGDAIKIYAAQSQKLDQTFPKRMVQQFGKDAPPEDVIRNKLRELEEKRIQLVSAGLLDKSDADQITEFDRIGEKEIRNFLRVYSEDTQKKLSVFDDLYEKINIFQNIIAEHLTFKKLKIDPKSGMKVEDDAGRIVPLNSLSSGEQHELVIIYDLLFRVSDNSLILVDEPELSLHVAWQKKFITDLQQIQKARPLNVAIATHSPQIINERWDLVTELDGGLE
ncbi:AAA family ATPase [Ochrobactrum sp. AN78]|uniref:AAA family ATPase n=1 Tax=Ochrobactrum sp. AN78 TaxID=3039853 RepID=UPI00298A0309|nr:AAA family ATPase [Ochrobactrum sp. AN78]MDH7790180.1 putative ATP-binding protein involved in virulence [Ochrobactrum sp. AN78]